MKYLCHPHRTTTSSTHLPQSLEFLDKSVFRSQVTYTIPITQQTEGHLKLINWRPAWVTKGDCTQKECQPFQSSRQKDPVSKQQQNPTNQRRMPLECLQRVDGPMISILRDLGLHFTIIIICRIVNQTQHVVRARGQNLSFLHPNFQARESAKVITNHQ